LRLRSIPALIASARTDAWTVRKRKYSYTIIIRRELLADQNIVVEGLVLWILFIKFHRSDEAESDFSNRTFRLGDRFRGLRGLRHSTTIQDPVLLCVSVNSTISLESRRPIHLSLP
jgi:hypothetical protein